MNEIQTKSASLTKSAVIDALCKIGEMLDLRLKRRYFLNVCRQNLNSPGETRSRVLLHFADLMVKRVSDEEIATQMRGIGQHISELETLDASLAICLRDVHRRMQDMWREESYSYEGEISTDDVEVLNVQAFVRALELQVQFLDNFSEQVTHELQGKTGLLKKDENRALIESLYKLLNEISGRRVVNTDQQTKRPAMVLIRQTTPTIWWRLYSIYRLQEMRR